MTAVPSWEGFIIPTLKALRDGVVRHRREVEVLAGKAAGLTDEQKTVTVASGSKVMYKDRVGWALSFLTNVGGLERPKRAFYQITPAGKDLIKLFPNGATELDIKALGEDPRSPIRLYEPTGPRKRADKPELASEESLLTPTEQVEEGIRRIREDVAGDLLKRLQGKDPEFFEQAVVQLLLAMGYGGTAGAGAVTPLSNDGGIDGVIDQDILGLSRVYIQAKRYANGNPVGRPDLQAFVGALSGKADRGVFITTSRFSDGAVGYAEHAATRIILVDGDRLTDLMIRYGVGVQVRDTYQVVEVDEDFFA